MTRQGFKQINYSKWRVSDLKERRKALQVAAEQITVKLTGMPHNSSEVDKMAEFAAQVDELDRMILEETMRLEHLRLEAEKAIDALPVQQKTVMELRYIHGMNWRKVARAANYSVDHCRKIERAALKALM